MSRQECKQKQERHHAALYRAARRTRRSINTHSGSSLSSSSLRGDDLHTVDTTEQVPGVGGGATRCYPQTPIARSRNSWHGSDAGSNTTHLPRLASTHSRTCHMGGRASAA